MAQHAWQDHPYALEQAKEIGDLDAEQFLRDVNAKCKSIQQLAHSDVPYIARDIVAACQRGYREGKAAVVQLLSGPLGSEQLLMALGGILSRLLQALETLHTSDTRFYWCTCSVCSALDWLLVLRSGGTTSAPPMSLRLALAKQLQHVELLQPLSTAVKQLGVVVSAQVAEIADTSSYDIIRTSEGMSSYLSNISTLACRDTEDKTLLVLARELATQLLRLAGRLCRLWPGGVHKSAAARPLLPAASNLAAAFAKLSSVQCRQELDIVECSRLLDEAVSTGCLLISAHLNAGLNIPESQLNGPESDLSYTRRTEYRLLLKLVLAAVAQLWCDCVDGHQRQQQQQGAQVNAVQRLWVALGYTQGQLLQVADTLRKCRRDTDVCAVPNSPHVIFEVKQLINALGCSYGQHMDSDPATLPAAAASHMPHWKRLLCEELVCADFDQLLLVMRVAEQMFLTGPEGVKGDIDLLLATVSCFDSFFASALQLYLLTPKAEQGEHPSAMFPLHEVVPLLLQFLQYGKEAVQRVTTADNSSGSDNSSTADQFERLQQAVLSVLQRLCSLTQSVADRGDARLQEAWLVWGLHVAELIEERLRRTASAADCDVDMLSELQQIVGPFAHAWLQISMSAGSSLDVVQQVCGSMVAVGSKQAPAAPAAGDAMDAPTCCRQQSTSSYNAQLASSDDAAITKHKPDNQASPSNLQLLSLMTSWCKTLMKTAELDDQVGALLIRTQLYSDSLPSAIACGIQQRAEQSLLQPAVRPWVSLLGRCLVMVGQRLKLLQVESSRPYLFANQESIHTQMLHAQHSMLETIQLQQVKEIQQVHSLRQAVKVCSAEVEKLRSRVATVKAQKGKQQLLKLLQLELQTRGGTLQKVQEEKERAVSVLQAVCDQQGQLKQDISKTKAELKLCTDVNSQQAQQIAADMPSSIEALLNAVEALLECWLQKRRQKQGRAAKDKVSSVAAADSFLEAVMQRLLSELLPTLIVMEGLCDLLLAGYFGISAPEEGDGEPFFDVWQECLVEKVSEGKALAWLHEQNVQEEVHIQSAVQAAAAPAAAQILSQLKAGPLKDQLYSQGPSCLLPVLLSIEVCQQLHEQLVVIGSELVTALPHCWCCNNPGCDNLSAHSELQLISSSDKEQVCTGCTGGSRDKDIKLTAARYCSVECQTQHWKQHKQVCRRLHKQRKQRR